MPEPATRVQTAPTALLVDDNDELRAAVAEQLAAVGYRVIEAADGDSALAHLSAPELRVDLLISDLRMPGIDGTALAARARAHRPDLPVVLISSHLDDALARRIDAGDVAFCRKPFALAELLEAIEAARAAPRPAPAASDARPAGHRRAATWLAAAAALLVAAGAALLIGRAAPPLPARSDDAATTDVTRSFRVEPLAPHGTLDAAPAHFDWRPADGASSYRLTVLRLDREPVWETRVAAPPAALPAEVAAGLDRAVLYTWRVEAIDAGGRRLAWSERVRFRIAPGQETSPGASP